MSLNVATIAEDETVRRAANLMRGRSIGCLAVHAPAASWSASSRCRICSTLLGKGGERRDRQTARASLHYRVPHAKASERRAIVVTRRTEV